MTHTLTPRPTPVPTPAPTTPEPVPTPDPFPIDRASVEGKLCVIFIDVGHGDSALIITPDQKTMLVDTGQFFAFHRIADVLDRLGIVQLDALLITHPDKDHIGSFVDIVANYSPQYVFLSPIFADDAYADFISYWALPDVGISYLKAGGKLRLGDALQFDVLAPRKANYKDINNTSIVFRMAYGDVSFLMMGDAVKESVAEMLKNYKRQLSSTILKAGHHGNPESTTKEFLRAVQASWLVISADPWEKHGEKIDSLEEQLQGFEDLIVYRTFADGTIIFVTDGTDIEIYFY
ncbi:MAG: MBL fold metallo-hydrolase [Clostridiales bacterium]|nr:MBL fold metallo-hydrolase [Clostridiales bacterium]